MSTLDVRLTPFGVSVSVHDDPDALADDPQSYARYRGMFERRDPCPLDCKGAADCATCAGNGYIVVEVE